MDGLPDGTCKECWYFSDERTHVCCCESSDYFEKRVWRDMVCPSFRDIIAPVDEDFEERVCGKKDYCDLNLEDGGEHAKEG